MESKNQALERDVQRHKEREMHQEKIEMLEKKRPWVVCEFQRQLAKPQTSLLSISFIVTFRCVMFDQRTKWFFQESSNFLEKEVVSDMTTDSLVT